jgi:hypothetical protein
VPPEVCVRVMGGPINNKSRPKPQSESWGGRVSLPLPRDLSVPSIRAAVSIACSMTES